MKVATVYVWLGNTKDAYDFPDLASAHSFKRNLDSKGFKTLLIVHPNLEGAMKIFPTLFMILFAFVMTSCGDISQLESQAKSQEAAAVPSPSPTPMSKVDIEVEQYGQVAPVSVAIGETEQMSPTESDAPLTCGDGKHGDVRDYLVMDRDAQGMPWNLVATDETENDADNEAQTLVNQGYYSWNVKIVPQYQDGCTKDK